MARLMIVLCDSTREPKPVSWMCGSCF